MRKDNDSSDTTYGDAFKFLSVCLVIFSFLYLLSMLEVCYYK